MCAQLAHRTCSSACLLAVCLVLAVCGEVTICNDAPGGDARASTCSLAFTASDGLRAQFLGRWELEKHGSFTIPFPQLLARANGSAELTSLSLYCECTGGADCAELHKHTSLKVFPSSAQLGGVPPLLSDSFAAPGASCDRRSCSVDVALPAGGVGLSPGSAVLRFGPNPPAPLSTTQSPPYALCHTTWSGGSSTQEDNKVLLHVTNKWTPAFDSQFCISTENLMLANSKLIKWQCDCHPQMDCGKQMASARLRIFDSRSLQPTAKSAASCAVPARNLTFSPMPRRCDASSCSMLLDAEELLGMPDAVGYEMCFAQSQ